LFEAKDEYVLKASVYVFGDLSMADERDIMLNVARKQKDCIFELRFVLRKKNDIWNNVSTILRLAKRENRPAIVLDYGDIVLGERFLSIEEGSDIISRILSDESERRQLTIKDYGEFPILNQGRPSFLPSKRRWGWVRSEYPVRLCDVRVIDSRASQEWNLELMKVGLPYYPNLNDAIIDFFGLSVQNVSSYGTIYLVVPDYRARIENLKLSFSKAEVKLSYPEMPLENLLLKVFAKADSTMISLPDIQPMSDSISFDIGFQPDFLFVVMVSREDEMKVDSKEFAKWIDQSEGVVIERPEEEIFSLTRIGESQDLEYKYDVKDDNQKNDFIETVVAFLNTNRGIILVGVADNGDVVGTHTNPEDVQKMIHDNCDPPPTGIKFEQKEIEGKKVIIIEVAEGGDKPYQSRRDKNWYARHNANDMKMERSELIRFWQERTQVRSFP
jgi:hypothetical protein